MKRTKRTIIVALVATVAITMSLVTTAFAAPATSNCPTKNLLNSLLGSSGSSLPNTGSALPANLQSLLGSSGLSLPNTGSALPSNIQSLLGQYGQPGTGTAATKCPKSQAAQQLFGNYGTSLLGSGTAVPTPTTTPAPAPTPAPTTGSTIGSVAPVSGNMSADESKMINLVNQDRANAGLKPLTFDSSLRAGALAHSQDMSTNNYFSHTSPTQGDFSARIRAAGVNYTSAGENIAQYGSVESAETGFMNSPGHRANILNTTFTRVGIGIVYNQSKGSYYITQWFAK